MKNALTVAILGTCVLFARADDFDQLKVGRQADGRIVVPTSRRTKSSSRPARRSNFPADPCPSFSSTIPTWKTRNRLRSTLEVWWEAKLAVRRPRPA